MGVRDLGLVSWDKYSKRVQKFRDLPWREVFVGFHYNKKDSRHRDEGVLWTSYSDLFMSLSVIFLLLYVVSSLRQGANSLQQNIEKQKLRNEIERLAQQLKVYDTLKDDYLQTDATHQDEQVYRDIMNRINLLADEAKTEKESLMKKAQENENKERALNQYQKLIQQVVNANMVSKSRLKRRDDIISKKNTIISKKHTELVGLEKTVAEKSRLIAKGEQEMAFINDELNKKMVELKSAYESRDISQKKYEGEVALIKEESRRKLDALKFQNNEVNSQLASASDRLKDLTTKLDVVQGDLERKDAKLKNISSEYQAGIDKLKAEFEAQKASDRAEFERTVKKHKMSAEAFAEKEAAFRSEAKRKEGELAGRIASLNDKIGETQGQLKKARDQANARKILAQEIKKNFALGGIAADIDPNTGDVMLDFGDHYFDTSRSDLKPGMKAILEKAMPLYSKSLFENKSVAQKINGVEIIGFASPTYRGKYIDPQTLDPGDRTAVDYNLDLSYNRARNIFRYIFDTNRMVFKHQKELLPLVKVTGRSFLAEKKRSVASDGDQAFCGRFDCMKAQRVIIKFTLED